MLKPIRMFLKRLLPNLVISRYDAFKVYYRRLVAWRYIMREMEGLEETDRRALKRSKRRAPYASLLNGAYYSTHWHPELIEDVRVQIQGVGRFHLRAHTDDIVHVMPSDERVIFQAVKEWLRPGDVFVDGGANIGFYSVLAAGLVGNEGRVCSVEMIPNTAAQMKKNIALNGLRNVRVVEHAISDQAGQTVQARLTHDLLGQATICPETGANHPDAIEVTTQTLDNILKDEPSIRLIKLDIEGVELEALKGAREVLRRTDALVVENWFGDPSLDAYIREVGFEITYLDPQNFLATRKTEAMAA